MMNALYESPKDLSSDYVPRKGYPIPSAVLMLFSFFLFMWFLEDMLFSQAAFDDLGESTLRTIIYVSFLIPLVIIHQALSLFMSFFGVVVFNNVFWSSFYRYQKLGYTLVTFGMLSYLFFAIGRKASFF